MIKMQAEMIARASREGRLERARTTTEVGHLRIRGESRISLCGAYTLRAPAGGEVPCRSCERMLEKALEAQR
jgi:hypothetical protein